MGFPLVEVVEKWNPHARVRHDLFSFIDVLAIQGDSVFAIQATSDSNIAARVAKLSLLPSVVHWLDTRTNRRLFVWGWGKKGARGKRKLWGLREVEVVLNETGKPVLKQ